MCSRSALGLLSFALALAAPALGEAGKMNDPSTYFSTIHELEGGRVDRLQTLLVTIGEECTLVEKKCPAGDELFALISGEFNLASQPIHLIYIDENNQIRTNVILHKHRVTPLLYGERNVWVLVFAENALDLTVGLTALWRQRRGSLTGLEGVFVSEGRETTEARAAQEDSDSLVFDRLSGSGEGDDIFYASERFYIEPLGVYTTSVHPVETPGEVRAGFVEARANFSNSLDRSVDLGLALGATLRTEPVDDLVLDGVNVGSANLNLYLMLDIYIIKPTLLSPMVHSFWGRYRPSIGIAIGTNLTFWDAQEFNVGVSLGHLVGRHGLVLGVNIINSPSADGQATDGGPSDDRLIRPYIAALFKF
jgi:hypothetical protein